jgi:hypothetical protein
MILFFFPEEEGSNALGLVRGIVTVIAVSIMNQTV